MVIKILFLILFAASCGPKVQLKENQLENPSLLTSTKSHEMTGTISKISGSAQVTYQGKTYKVSQYSSKNAQNFIEAMSTSSSVSITFSGGFKDSEVVLESVR